MASCCYGDEYGEVFTEDEASRTVRRFRRRGLRGTALELSDALIDSGIAGATVLEVGGGVGHLHTHLLRAGAGRAVNIDLSPSWEASARELLAELGLEDRVERRVGDLVDEASGLPEADVVVLHRVLCCYPDWRAMVDAAVSRSPRTIGLTVPVDRWWTRSVAAVGNLFERTRGREFRAHVHPLGAVLARIAEAGFSVRYDRSRPVWRTLVLQRT